MMARLELLPGLTEVSQPIWEKNSVYSSKYLSCISIAINFPLSKETFSSPFCVIRLNFRPPGNSVSRRALNPPPQRRTKPTSYLSTVRNNLAYFTARIWLNLIQRNFRQSTKQFKMIKSDAKNQNISVINKFFTVPGRGEGGGYCMMQHHTICHKAGTVHT